MPAQTPLEIAQRAARAFEAAGWTTADARLDAEVMARALLGWDAADWLSRQREPAPESFAAPFEASVRRRLRHEPVAYILREREFYGRVFRVTPDVLIPRPETELIIDEALALLPIEQPGGRAILRAADVGTGSGCLAITLALERSDVCVTASDTSASALAVAAANATALGAGDRLRFVRASLLEASADDAFDLVVSNPPYVRDADRAALMPDVRDHEPPAALFAGPDGLAIIRELLPASARTLRQGGWLLMEIGAGQAPEVTTLVEATSGLAFVRVSADLAGIPRVLIAQRSAAS